MNYFETGESQFWKILQTTYCVTLTFANFPDNSDPCNIISSSREALMPGGGRALMYLFDTTT